VKLKNEQNSTKYGVLVICLKRDYVPFRTYLVVDSMTSRSNMGRKHKKSYLDHLVSVNLDFCWKENTFFGRLQNVTLFSLDFKNLGPMLKTLNYERHNFKIQKVKIR